MPDVSVFMTFFVRNASLHRDVAEHRAHGFPERFRSVEHEQHSLLGIEASLDQIGQQRGRDGRVLRRPLPEPERDLHPLRRDPQCDDHHPALQLQPIEHHHRETQIRELARHQRHQRIAGALDERPRHRRLRCRPRLDLDLLADRLLRAAIPASGHAGEDPLQHDPRHRIAIGEMLVRLQRHVTLAIRGPNLGRFTSTRRPPSVTSPSSWPSRTAVRSRFHLPFGPTTSSTSSSIIELSTPSSTATLRESNPSFAAPTSWPSASCTRSGSTASCTVACATGTLLLTAVPPSILVGSPATLPPGADGPGGTAVTSNFYTLRDNLAAEVAGS